MNLLGKLFESIRNKRMYISRGDGMLLSFSKAYGNRSCILHNSSTGEDIPILDEDGHVVFAKENDFFMTDPKLMSNKDVISKLVPRYGFSVNEFVNGVASISWTLQPDGRYWEDEDGFGGTDDEEENMYAYIDKHGKVVLPFQWAPSYVYSESILRPLAEACSQKPD